MRKYVIKKEEKECGQRLLSGTFMADCTFLALRSKWQRFSLPDLSFAFYDVFAREIDTVKRRNRDCIAQNGL